MLDSLFQDLRYGWRMLIRNKGLSITAVLSLALGIGANMIAFGVADALLLKELPVRNPQELILFRWTAEGPSVNDEARRGTVFSSSIYKAFVEENRTLSDLFAFAPLPGQINVVVDGRPAIASGELVSGNYYSGLGVSAFLGRTLTPDDDRPSADPVAMISYTYWQERFGRDPGVVGKRVTINNAAFTIVGVTAAEFYGALKNDGSDVAIPIGLETQMALSAPSLRIMGRMKSSVTIPQVTANFENILEDDDAARRLDIANGATGLEYVEEGIQPAVILHAIGGIILLVICMNVANLMLARSGVREQEVTVRTALGAGRLRIVRLFLTESILLALVGGGLGIATAQWGIQIFAANNALARAITIDWRTLVFTVLLSVFTGIFFGLAPALQSSRAALMPALKDSARNIRGSRSWIGKTLIVSQMALSLMLLTGAGLLARTLYDLQNINVGFNNENLISFVVNPQLNRYTDAQTSASYERMIAGIQGIAGVRAVTLANLPMLGGGNPGPVFVEGSGMPTQASPLRVRNNFFETMEIPILLGRLFGVQDDQNGPPVAIISETVARQHFGAASPIGKHLRFAADRSGEVEIVGVVRNAKYFRLSDPNAAIIYMPAAQAPVSPMFFAIRIAGDAQTIMPAIREAVGRVDTNLALSAVATTTEERSDLLRFSRFAAGLGSVFGLTILGLACIGLYGIMSYNVANRTSEIGVRMALGARRSHVMGLVMGQTARLVLVGLAVGLPAGVGVSKMVSVVFYGVSPTDPLTIAAAIVVMIGVTALAGYLPARRAARLDPMIALKRE